MTRASTRTVRTPHGPARVHLRPAQVPWAALVLGHGAGGGVDAPDLTAVTERARADGLTVALVEQPYRVAERRAPAPAAQLDAAWIAVVTSLRRGPLAGLPVVVGGRSSGARVACRTAAATEPAGVLCLAFPLIPPLRRDGTRGESRIGELEAVRVPLLVVQGETDRFGVPPAGRGRRVVVVRGDHALRSDRAAVADAVGAWLPRVCGKPR